MGIPDVQKWLSGMQVDVDDTDAVFELIDVDGDGDLTVEELVAGMSRLKGSAKAYKLAELRKSLMNMKSDVSELKEQFTQQMRATKRNSSSDLQLSSSDVEQTKQICNSVKEQGEQISHIS